MTINRDLNQALVPYFQRVISLNDQIFKRFLTEKVLLILLLIWTPAILVQTLHIQHSSNPMVHWVSENKPPIIMGPPPPPPIIMGPPLPPPIIIVPPPPPPKPHDKDRDLKGVLAGTVVGASVAIIAVAAQATAAVTMAPAVAAGVVVWLLVRSFL